MSQKRPRATASTAPPPETPVPGRRLLIALAGLGAASSAWAAFLWRQLLVARAGGTPVCGPGDEGQCAALWDGAFASSVQRLTGLPVAGWGLGWGLVALLLPLLALRRPSRDLSTAIKWTAVGGAAAVVALLAASAVERTFCLPCFASHLLAAAYAFLALLRWPVPGWVQSPRGLGMAATLGLAAFLLLLYPGQRTPPARTELRELLPPTSPPATTAAVLPPTTSLGTAPPADRPRPDAASSAPPSLDAFVASLPPTAQQMLSDALAGYRAAPEAAPQRSRLLIGAMSAPVRITEFTDVLCPHCAELHETLETMREQAPRGSFQIEPRQYPLDGECNPQVRRGGAPVRCLAAKASICLEGRPGYLDFAGALFGEQQSLTPEKVRALASAHLPAAELERCLESPDTAAKLADDIREASRHDFQGTPLVLVNGRKGNAFGPFLYAVVLSRGLPWHPAFNLLPPPRLAADAHQH